MRFLAGLAIVALASTALAAQTVETPVPFDSAQRVHAVTPALVERLQLGPPFWTIAGAYREARLYSVSPGGGFVLVVQRPSGAFERYTLTSAERTGLGGAIDAATMLTGRPTSEIAADIVSEPAGNAFARHLTFLSAAVYGPLAASLMDEGAAAGAAYLATTGLTFFASYGAAQQNNFTRAQTELAADLGLAAGTAGWLLGFAASNNSDKGVRAIALGSAAIGTMAGVSAGARLSDAEAHAAVAGIETVAATTLAVASVAGFGNRSTAATVALVGGLGYPLGVWYPSHASYNLTAGDVQAISTSGLVGMAFAAGTLGDNPGGRRISGTLAAGYLVGELVGDAALARPFNLSQSQANILKVGALAGGLVGLAIPVASSNDNIAFGATSVGLGATVGMAILASSFPESSRRTASLTARPATGIGRRLGAFSVDPFGVLSATMGAPGRHVFARLVF